MSLFGWTTDVCAGKHTCSLDMASDVLYVPVSKKFSSKLCIVTLIFSLTAEAPKWHRE